ncbi:MAG: hypothetical protein HYW05_04690 [Candidatus Diapherotrites archaeon]|nr:hypothetical protein [Candidatus Diapherotrites archaeon]
MTEQKSGKKLMEAAFEAHDMVNDQYMADSIARVYLKQMESGPMRIDRGNFEFIEKFTSPKIKKIWNSHVRRDERGRCRLVKMTGKSAWAFLTEHRGPFKRTTGRRLI